MRWWLCFFVTFPLYLIPQQQTPPFVTAEYQWERGFNISPDQISKMKLSECIPSWEVQKILFLEFNCMRNRAKFIILFKSRPPWFSALVPGECQWEHKFLHFTSWFKWTCAMYLITCMHCCYIFSFYLRFTYSQKSKISEAMLAWEYQWKRGFENQQYNCVQNISGLVFFFKYFGQK